MCMSNGSFQSPYERVRQSTFFWGCAGSVLAIILTVVAAMSHDDRWLLLFAWPFAAFAIWEFARTWSISRNIIWSITFLGAVLSGLLLVWLYMSLAPIEHLAKAPSEIDTEYAGLSNSQLKNVVLFYTREMRGFEEQYDNLNSELLFNKYQILPGMSQDDKIIVSSERTNAIIKQENEERTQFDDKFLAKSRSLQAELTKRLGIDRPNPIPSGGVNNGKIQSDFLKNMMESWAENTMETGFVTGAHPIANVANYLDDLANNP
jgi:hypothetical protein